MKYCARIPKTMLQRGLQAASGNTLIALFLMLIGTRSFWENLVYAQCIGLSIWALIDSTRTYLITDWATQRSRLIWIVPVCVVLGYVAGLLLAGQLMGDDAVAFVWAAPRKTLGMLTMSLVAGAVLTYYFLSREQLREARSRAEALQRQAAESQLRLLQSQLEPHMLFNTLANLQALISSDPAKASDMLDRLIAYLRATLQASRATTHPLQTEFDRLGDYLALMAVRGGRAWPSCSRCLTQSPGQQLTHPTWKTPRALAWPMCESACWQLMAGDLLLFL